MIEKLHFGLIRFAYVVKEGDTVILKDNEDFITSINRDKEIELVQKISLNAEMKSLFKCNDNSQEEHSPFPHLRLVWSSAEPSGCHEVHRGRCFNVDYTPRVSI